MQWIGIGSWKWPRVPRYVSVSVRTRHACGAKSQSLCSPGRYAQARTPGLLHRTRNKDHDHAAPQCAAAAVHGRRRQYSIRIDTGCQHSSITPDSARINRKSQTVVLRLYYAMSTWHHSSHRSLSPLRTEHLLARCWCAVVTIQAVLWTHFSVHLH